MVNWPDVAQHGAKVFSNETGPCQYFGRHGCDFDTFYSFVFYLKFLDSQIPEFLDCPNSNQAGRGWVRGAAGRLGGRAVARSGGQAVARSVGRWGGGVTRLFGAVHDNPNQNVRHEQQLKLTRERTHSKELNLP